MLDISKIKEQPYEELRALYKQYLHSLNISKATINTAYVDTFYLWRKDSKAHFWDTILSYDFESEARTRLTKTLSEHSTGNVNALVSGYLSHLRRFRLFINSDSIWEQPKVNQEKPAKNTNARRIKTDIDIPSPTVEQVEFYLTKWDGLENYHLQEDALNKLFIELCPNNTDIIDILLKASTLNDFYSTNIFSIYPVAKHICSLNIDARLNAGDVTLVRDIQHVTISNKRRSFYSFTTKYCSHHNPLDYPIYDSYVDEVLRHYRNRDDFSNFQNEELKEYVRFKDILIDFRDFYGLDKYNLKQIDQYVWQLGKDYFPKNYGKKKRGDK